MNNWTTYTEQLSQLPLLSTVTRTKEQLDAIRPLQKEVEDRVMQKIRLEWNFHSNAIEGNKLTRGETYTFLMQGLTAKAKPFKDHQDIKGHNKAIDFLFDLVKDQRDLTEGDIRDLHKIILVEPYKNPALTPDGQKATKTIQIGEYKTQPNFPLTATGEIHYYALPEETPILMQELVEWYNKARHNEKIHPSVLAAFVHHRFVEIHPFDDGNGRLGRMLMNLILIKRNYPPVIIRQDKRDEYYSVLSQADKKEYKPLVEFIAESVLDSMNLYLKAAKGENIEEEADLEKEIALFKASLEKTYTLRSFELEKELVYSVLLPIYDKSVSRFSSFDELFQSVHHSFDFNGQQKVNREFFENSYIEDSCYKITALHKWSNFIKSKNPFTLNTWFSLIFNDTTFEVEIDNKKIETKYYDERFTSADIERLANIWVRSAFDKLKKQTNGSSK